MRKLVAVLLFLSTPCTVGAGQDLRVSKKATGLNVLPDLAINPTTGDVLVVWTQLDLQSSSSSAWGALLKRRRSGKYSVKKRVRISPGEGFHGNVRAAWDDSSGAYLAVWDTRTTQPGTGPSDILARTLKPGNGKPAGGVVTLISDGSTNYSPDVQPATGAESRGLRVLYVSRALDKLKGLGSTPSSAAKNVVLVTEGEGAGTKLFTVKREQVILENVLIRRALSADRSVEIGLTLTNEVSPNGVTRAVVRLLQNGVVAEKIDLGPNTFGLNLSGEIDQFTTDISAFLVYRDPDEQIRGLSLSGADGQIFDRSPTRQLSPTIIMAAALAPLVSEQLSLVTPGLIVADSSDKSVKELALAPHPFDTTHLFSHDNDVAQLNFSWLPGVESKRGGSRASGAKPNAVVVWTRTAPPDLEVLAHFYSSELDDGEP